MRRQQIIIHSILCIFLFFTMLPFLFVINNSFRTNSEMYHSFFGVPKSIVNVAKFSYYKLKGDESRIVLRPLDTAAANSTVRASEVKPVQMSYTQALGTIWKEMTRGYKFAWSTLRPYMLNSLLVSLTTVCGVLLLGSLSGYVFSRYRFPGRDVLFVVLLSIIMIPGILTLVPSFLLVKKLGLLNSYWVLILPYISGGQIFAIFLFKGFFDGLPEDLFESARIDGAGHVSLYLNIVLPLSKQIIAVIAVMNILGTWNEFLWPFITNSSDKFHVVASGLYLMGASPMAQNMSTMFAGYILASMPLIVLFVYATKPFMQGITSGAFKA